MEELGEVFDLVAERIVAKADSLTEMVRFKRTGIEAWLKVEAVAALKDKVTGLQNRGPDIVLKSGGNIELKGATDLNPAWIFAGLKYGCPCLFIGCAGGNELECLQNDWKMELAFCRKIIAVGSREWILGMVIPKKMD